MAITAQAVVERMQQKLAPWKDTPNDGFFAGKPETEVTGIVTTYAPSLDILKKAVASGKNMIVSRESPFWSRPVGRPGTSPTAQAPGAAPRRAKTAFPEDPIYQSKLEYIDKNNLVVYRLFDNWNSRPQDAQLQGLAKALGWEKYYKPSGGQPWAVNNGFFEIPPATLKAAALDLKKKLGAKSIRVGGDPDLKVSKVALSHGMYWLTDLHQWLAEPGVDLLVVGEPQWENELGQYSFDLADSGMKKGTITLGQQVSEEPGCGEMATWIKSLVAEVPVQWIPGTEPAWMPY